MSGSKAIAKRHANLFGVIIRRMQGNKIGKIDLIGGKIDTHTRGEQVDISCVVVAPTHTRTEDTARQKHFNTRVKSPNSTVTDLQIRYQVKFILEFFLDTKGN